jgi:hypothetical protein
MSEHADSPRRRFLRTFLPSARPDPDPTWDDYFGSYAIACAQVNEARPFLLDEARRLGIDAAGLSDVEILKAIFMTTGRPDSRPRE